MLINSYWLKKNIKKKNIKVLDASWYLPNINRDAKKEYKQERIPGAVFFDIDDVSDKKSSLPHMLPCRKTFEKKISDLGVRKNDYLVIYCKEGIMSSPRAWWMFKYFGHNNVFILNGGFRAWRQANGRIESGNQKIKLSSYKTGRIKWNLNTTYSNLINYKKEKKEICILDARPKARFLEIDPEPRKNIGKGNIEGSYSLEYSLLDRNGFLKNKSELRVIFRKTIKENHKIICSCGSGVSACALAFSLNYISNYAWSVYDGSWTEWYLKTRS